MACDLSISSWHIGTGGGGGPDIYRHGHELFTLLPSTCKDELLSFGAGKRSRT